MNRGQKAGYSILEMLGYIAVFAVILNLAVSLFISTTRLSAYATTAMDRIEGIEEVHREFADAVHEAVDVSPGVASYVSGGDRLVLELPQAPGGKGGARYAVLGDLKGNGRMAKLILTERDGAFETEYMATYGQIFVGIRFLYNTVEPAGARLVRLELEVDNATAKNTIPRVNTFAASLRGVGS